MPQTAPKMSARSKPKRLSQNQKTPAPSPTCAEADLRSDEIGPESEASSKTSIGELPDLAAINRQLAASNARMLDFLDSLPEGIDQLVDAAEADDWPQVNRLSKSLAYGADLHGFDDLAHTAREVTDADNQMEAKRRVIRLIGRCGRVGQPKRHGV